MDIEDRDYNIIGIRFYGIGFIGYIGFRFYKFHRLRVTFLVYRDYGLGVLGARGWWWLWLGVK
jgi:hypothetical protein